MKAAAGRRGPLPYAALSVLFAYGCGAAATIGLDLEAVQGRLEGAARDGAHTCAPREFAVGRAHLTFARVELDQGELDDARWHVRQADLHARAAQRLSPHERCAVPLSASERALPSPSALPSSGADSDRDLDGRIDAIDQCPLEAEDLDGHMDADGCPDIDADADGDAVEDGVDKCPAEPGSTLNQGCPRLRYRGLELTPSAIRLLEPVLFDDGGATIRSVSHGVLDSVVELLREHRAVTLDIEGHTDSQGVDAVNLALSQARAEAVLRYLVDRGVSATRLTAKGYGETRPMESNRTSQGRALNRRIELVRRDGGP